MITLEEIRQVLTELHNIARELNKPFDSGDVLCEHSKRNNGYSKEIAETVIHPIYYAPEECAKKVSAIIDDDGHITHIKTEHDDDYRPLL